MNRNLVLIFLVAIAGGSITPFAKLAFDGFGPFTLLVIRFAVAALILYFFLPKQRVSKEKFKTVLPIAIVGATNPIFFFTALQYIPASLTPLLYAFVPSLTIAYLYFTRGLKTTQWQLLGIAVGLFGVALLSDFGFAKENGFERIELGVGLIMIAILAFTVFSLQSREALKANKVSAEELAFYFSVVTVIISTPFMVYEFSNGNAVASPTVNIWLSALYIGIATSVQYLFLQKALKVMSAARATIFTYVQPLIGVTLAIILLDESLSSFMVIGGIFVLTGAQLSQHHRKTA